MLPGFLPSACNQRVGREQGRSIRFRREPVGPAKPTKREGYDDRVEVRLTDSTSRSGESATWESGHVYRTLCVGGWVSSALLLEPTKTKLVEFGRFAQRHAGTRGRNRPETIYFLGLTLYCTRNRKGNFRVGMRTEKSRLRRSLMSLQEMMRKIRHDRIGDQVGEINAVLRGHYAYYGVAGNIRSLKKVYRAVERYWLRMLRSRSWSSSHLLSLIHI